MFFGFLFWMFFIFRSAVLADDVSISWISVPSSASINTQFDLQVQVTGIAGTTYYLRADDGKDCSMELKKESNNIWSNSCNVGISEMQSITLDNSGSGKEILRLREISSSGNKTLYSYVYDADKTLLSTSTAGSITINTVTPTPTITSTPTPTPTLAVTSTPTPTPTSAPVIEPTVFLEPTVVPIVVGATESSDDSFKESKSFKDYLPIILVILGLLMFIGPVFVPKIIEKIKSKRRGPPQEPPQILEHFKSQQPTLIRETTFDGGDIRLE